MRTLAPFLRGCLGLILLRAHLRDALDQAVRYRFIQWKTEIAFGATVVRQRFVKAYIAFDRGNIPMWVLKAGEINKNSVASERRHSVTDGFLRVRSCAAKDFANATESGLGRWR